MKCCKKTKYELTETIEKTTKLPNGRKQKIGRWHITNEKGEKSSGPLEINE